MVKENEHPGIFTIMKIGYTIDGSFDPNHEDFKICYNKCHIHKAMIVTSILSIIMSILLILIVIGAKLFYSIEFLQSLGSFILSVILAISVLYWKKCYNYLKLYLFYLVADLMAYFGYIIYLIVFTVILSLQNDENEPAEAKIYNQLLTLIQIMFVTTRVCFSAWSFYCCYVEYKFLKGQIKYNYV